MTDVRQAVKDTTYKIISLWYVFVTSQHLIFFLGLLIKIFITIIFQAIFNI